MGAFFYVYCGVGATAAFNIGTLAKEAGVGCMLYQTPAVLFYTNKPAALLTVGLGYAVGIVAAITIAGSVSGGHFNPCISIAMAIWRGFPWRKVPGYVQFW